MTSSIRAQTLCPKMKDIPKSCIVRRSVRSDTIISYEVCELDERRLAKPHFLMANFKFLSQVLNSGLGSCILCYYTRNSADSIGSIPSDRLYCLSMQSVIWVTKVSFYLGAMFDNTHVSHLFKKMHCPSITVAN